MWQCQAFTTNGETITWRSAKVVMLSHWALSRTPDRPFPPDVFKAVLHNSPNKQLKLHLSVPTGQLSVQEIQTPDKSNYGQTNLLLSLPRSTDSFSCSLTFPGSSSPWWVLLSPLCPARAARSWTPQDMTRCSWEKLLPTALQKEQLRQETARQLSLFHLALFTLSNVPPNSHFKLQKNQLGSLSHGINQK